MNILNQVNEFLDTYKQGIPVTATVRVDTASVAVLAAAILLTGLLLIVAKKYLA